MNDEFLHRLRRQPPAAFAARLRARLESEAMVRHFRGRQITLYALIASLLGGTALAWVSPSVRGVASSMIQQVLPESVVNVFESRSQPAASRPHARPMQTPAHGGMQPESTLTAGAGVTAVANSPTGPDNSTMAVDARNSSVLGGPRTAGPVPPSVVTAEPVIEVAVEGAKVAASVVSLAVQPFQQRQRWQRPVRIGLRGSSSERGLQKLCSGDIDIALATRPILAAEVDTCRRADIAFIELPVAYEALAIVVNVSNDWADAISPDNLQLLFDPASQGSVIGWNELQPKWPTAAISLAAPRPGQGFLESFCEMVLRRGPSNRSDIRLERDEVGLTAYVQRNVGGLTYLPLASYLKNESQSVPVRPLKVLNSRGIAVSPSKESIADRSYEPLSRLLLIYIRSSNVKGGAAEDFVRYLLRQADTLLPESRYLPLESAEYRLAEKVLRSGLTGTVFDSEAGAPLTAREILLRHFPESQREQERIRLDRTKGR